MVREEAGRTERASGGMPVSCLLSSNRGLTARGNLSPLPSTFSLVLCQSGHNRCSSERNERWTWLEREWTELIPRWRFGLRWGGRMPDRCGGWTCNEVQFRDTSSKSCRRTMPVSGHNSTAGLVRRSSETRDAQRLADSQLIGSRDAISICFVDLAVAVGRTQKSFGDVRQRVAVLHNVLVIRPRRILRGSWSIWGSRRWSRAGPSRSLGQFGNTLRQRRGLLRCFL